MTIIHNISAYDDFPFKSLNPGEVAALRLAATKKELPIIRFLECFLEITGRSLCSDKSGYSHQSCIEFIGALYSNSFYKASSITKYRLARSFIKLAPLVWPHLSEVIKIKTSPEMTPDIYKCIAQYEAVPIIEEKIWLWRGWSALNRNNKRVFFPLYPIFEKFGRTFTQQLSDASSNFIVRGKFESIPGLASLVSFLTKNHNKSNEANFLDPEYMHTFWRKFIIYHFECKYNDGDGASINHLRISWRPFLLFVQNHLNKSGAFTKARGAMPTPKIKPEPVKTKTRKSGAGVEVSCKLLTDIPLELSDNQAMDLLFIEIKKDFDIIVQWARAKVHDMNTRLDRRYSHKDYQELDLDKNSTAFQNLRSGQSDSWITSARAIIRLERLGYQVNARGLVQKGYSLSSAAHDCALPNTNCLLPHCTVLVAKHGEITASFLEKLQVYEKNGIYEAYTTTDGAYILTGQKSRKGSETAEQHIFLDNETTQVIDDVLRSTKPARDFLKLKNDDNWKYLFLTTGEGFAWPKRISLANATNVTSRLSIIADELQEICGVTKAKAKSLVDSFNMGSLRASSGAIVYIETGSSEQAAKKLGHEGHQPNLMKRYLPKILLDFFLERWVRIFQEGIIIHAMSGSKRLVDAVNSKNMDEVDAFLSAHVLGLDKLYEPPKKVDNPKGVKDITIISLSVEIITVLIGIQLYVTENLDKANAQCVYWAKFANRIKSYINSEANLRHDFKAMFEEAESIAVPLALVEV